MNSKMILLLCHTKVKELKRVSLIGKKIGLVKILKVGCRVHLLFMNSIRIKISNYINHALKKLS